jgi:putative ABC transport system permease protein
MTSLSVALESLRLHPLRTALSTLGIVMGAASLAAVLSLGDGAERFARARVEHEGLNLLVLKPRTEDMVDGLRVPVSSFPLFTESDAQQVADAAGPGTSVVLRMEGTGLVNVPGDRPRGVRVVAESIRAGAPSWTVARGRALTTVVRDGRGGPTGEALVSDRLAATLAAHGLAAPGSTITLAGSPRTVVGVLAPFPGEREFVVIVPWASADASMVPSPAPRPRTIAISAAKVEDVPRVKAAVERVRDARGDWKDRVRVEASGPGRLKQVAQGILIFKMLMGAFTAVSLLVGGIGITNVLLASLLERTREIGIRKAVGARRRDLVLQFLAESVAIAAGGALVGAAIGVAGAMGVTALIRAKTEAAMFAALTWQTVAISAGAALVVGVLAGVYPAVRASRLTPTDAIQRE